MTEHVATKPVGTEGMLPGRVEVLVDNVGVGIVGEDHTAEYCHKHKHQHDNKSARRLSVGKYHLSSADDVLPQITEKLAYSSKKSA